MSQPETPPVGVSLSEDVEYREDRRQPYRARVRWVDPVTKRRKSRSVSFGDAELAQRWVDAMQRAARGGVDPVAATMSLAEYGDAEEARELVAARLDVVSEPDGRLFAGPRGGRISTAVLRDATHWDEVVTRLGYEHLRRHDLRHTGLTWLADAGVQVNVLRKIAGHGSLSTTQRYLHPDDQSITDAGDDLSAHISVRRSPNGPQLRVV
jgi:integrase